MFKQPRLLIVPFVAAALTLALCSVAQAWIWDIDEDRIDDRIERVMSKGQSMAHVDGNLALPLIISYHPEDSPATFGVYMAYDHKPLDSDVAALLATGAQLTWRPRYINYL